MTDEINRFCHKHDITGGFVVSSAHTGKGLETLRELMEVELGRAEHVRVVTIEAFKRIREYVLRLKGNRSTDHILADLAELRQLVAGTTRRKISPSRRSKPLSRISPSKGTSGC